MTDEALAQVLRDLAQTIFDRGPTAGTSGSLSVRRPGGSFVTPTNASRGRPDPARVSRLDDFRHSPATRPPTRSPPPRLLRDARVPRPGGRPSPLTPCGGSATEEPSHLPQARPLVLGHSSQARPTLDHTRQHLDPAQLALVHRKPFRVPTPRRSSVREGRRFCFAPAGRFGFAATRPAARETPCGLRCPRLVPGSRSSPAAVQGIAQLPPPLARKPLEGRASLDATRVGAAGERVSA